MIWQFRRRAILAALATLAFSAPAHAEGDLVRGANGIEEGMPEHFLSDTLPKFRPGGLLLIHAGGSAGLFSEIIGGWVSGPGGSQPTTKEVRP